MATTVAEAFNKFLEDHVNLDPEVVKRARASRRGLIDVIEGFEGNVSNFPRLFSSKHISFGSFARNTKIRPLDDIDEIICLHAESSTYQPDFVVTAITVKQISSPLNLLTHDNSNFLNSTRVLNKFRSALSDVQQYEKAEISRNKEAVTLKLKSYPWNFDIVPGFYTLPEPDQRSYHLIPDGRGHWKKTDPSLDRALVTSLNTRNEGHMLNLIRVLKYWNKRPTMPSMMSYLLESIMLHYIAGLGEKSISQFVHRNLADAFSAIGNRVLYDIKDPKGIQGNLNDLSDYDRSQISERALKDASRANSALRYEQTEEIKKSIDTWKSIFGPDFPDYG